MNLEERIRRDARQVAADPEVSALHACLAEHLFEPDLDAAFLTRKCGATRAVRDRLTAELGPLKTYVTELRMTEAARLVRRTDLAIPELGKRLGYRVARTFRRAFTKHYGVTPSAMRKQARAERTPGPATIAAGARQGLEAEGDGARERPRGEGLTPRALAADLRRRAALGLLDGEQGGELRHRLRRLHPALAATGDDLAPPREPSAEPFPPVLLTPVDPRLERIAATAVLGRVLELPEADLRHALLGGLALGTSTAFEVLKELCYELAPHDPRRAVAVAELGVQLIDHHRDLLGDEGDAWKVVAWTFLARVRMLVGDFGAADQALVSAWEEVGEVAGSVLTGSVRTGSVRTGSVRTDSEGRTGTAMAPWAELEVRQMEGLLRVHQGRGGEAAAALDRAVELGRGLDRRRPHRMRTLRDRLELASLQGDVETALPLCDELEELAGANAADGDDVAFWRASACYHRGKAEATAGRDEEAERGLRQAADHIFADPEAAREFELATLGSFVLHELGRLAGRSGRLEEHDSLLRAALERYRQLRMPVLEAAAVAELAVLTALRGRAAEARQLAASALELLDRLPGHRRTWSAARRLRALARDGGAEATEDELAETLAALSAELDSVRWEITAPQVVAAARARRTTA